MAVFEPCVCAANIALLQLSVAAEHGQNILHEAATHHSTHCSLPLPRSSAAQHCAQKLLHKGSISHGTPLPPLPVCSNVAQHCAQKLLDEGAIVLGMSDSRGYVFERGGFTREQLAQVSGQSIERGRCCAGHDCSGATN